MRQVVFDISEMSDSKEIYGQRPNPFLPAFIYTIVGLLIAAVLYCCIGKIEIVATASGVIRPNEDIATVSSLRGGKVTEVNYYNGKTVHAGDVLLTVDTAELQIQLASLQKAKQDYELQLQMTDKFLGGIETGENPFSDDPTSEEYTYYIQFENYLLQLKNTQQTFDFDVDKTTSNITVLSRQIKNLEAQIAGWTSYKDSVIQKTNLAAEHPEYERMYLLYVATMDALKGDYESQKKQIELSYSTLPKDDKDAMLENLEDSYKTAVDQEYYQTIIQIENTLHSLQAELTSAKASLQQNQIARQLYKKNTTEDGEALSVSVAVIEQTSALLNQRESLQAKIDEVETQILQTEEQILQGTISATCGGTVSTAQTIVAGDVISSGTVIATIIPANENAYKVQVYVNNADIANIEVGDTVKYSVAALPRNQYGTVNGTVTNISADTLIQDGEYSGYYLVECTIERNSLTDHDGNSGTISTGMQVEAKIVTQEKTIIQYLLEKIDVF